MSNINFILLIVALVEAFSVDGQSTVGDCDVKGLNFAPEMPHTILDEIRYIQNRMNICGINGTEIKDLLTRLLNSMNQSVNDQLKAVDKTVRNCMEMSERLQSKFENFSKRSEEHDENIRSVGRLLAQHDQYSKNQSAASSCSSQDVRRIVTWPRDCADIRKSGLTASGVYKVYAIGLGFLPYEISVYCDMSSSTEGWLVFQRRNDGSETFKRTWTEYAKGFGNLRGEFWLGNNELHLLNLNKNYKLRIELEDFDGGKRYAEYSQFAIGSASDNYRLRVSGYTGNAGDDLAFHNGQQFSTIDADHDDKSFGSCAQEFHGGWWYANCHMVNINGLYLRGAHETAYAEGVEWGSFRGHKYSLKKTEMKIAPRN